MYGRFCKACWALGRGWVDAVVSEPRVLCAAHAALYGVVEPWVESRWFAPMPEGSRWGVDYPTIACPCGEEHDIAGTITLTGTDAVQEAGNERTHTYCGFPSKDTYYTRLTFIDKWVAYLFALPADSLTRENFLEDMRADTFTRV